MEDKSFYLVGIAGGSASGKTTFLENLKNHFSENELCVISQDDYYKPIDAQSKDKFGVVNFDLPSSIDDKAFYQDIASLSKGKEVRIKEYMFNVLDGIEKFKTLRSCPIVVVEGLFIFWFEEIANLLDLKIFIDARDDIRYNRRLKRDVLERAYSESDIQHQWKYHVHPAFQRYLAPFREDADIIITNNDNFNKGFELVCHHFESLLKNDME